MTELLGKIAKPRGKRLDHYNSDPAGSDQHRGRFYFRKPLLLVVRFLRTVLIVAPARLRQFSSAGNKFPVLRTRMVDLNHAVLRLPSAVRPLACPVRVSSPAEPLNVLYSLMYPRLSSSGHAILTRSRPPSRSASSASSSRLVVMKSVVFCFSGKSDQESIAKLGVGWSAWNLPLLRRSRRGDMVQNSERGKTV